MTISTKAQTVSRKREERATEEKTTAPMPKRMTLTLTPAALALLEPLRPKLQEFWRSKGYRLKPGEVMYELEKNFGAEIVQNLCIPQGIKDFECLIIARAVAAGVDRLDVVY